MAVYHVLKDGTRPKTINGHIVKMSDAAALYRLLDSLNKRPPKEAVS